MLRRSLLTTAVVSLAGALTPTIPAKAGTDPVAFVNNLTTQLEMVAGNLFLSKDGRDFASCSMRISTAPGSAALYSAASRES